MFFGEEQRGAAPFGGAESHERSSWSPPGGRAGCARFGRLLRGGGGGWQEVGREGGLAGRARRRGEDGRRPPAAERRASGPEGRFGGAERRRACGLILRAVQVTKCNNYAGLDFAGGFGGAVEKGKYGRNG